MEPSSDYLTMERSLSPARAEARHQVLQVIQEYLTQSPGWCVSFQTKSIRHTLSNRWVSPTPQLIRLVLQDLAKLYPFQATHVGKCVRYTYMKQSLEDAELLDYWS